MPVTESVFVLHAGPPLVGVVTRPAPQADPRKLPGVLLLGPGLYHHAGPHRFNVKLARRLAALGFPVLRMAFSGVGDSPRREDGVARPQSEIIETRAAMAQLAAEYGLDRFVLVGFCSGAAAALQIAWEDPGVAAVLINPFNLSLEAGAQLRMNVQGRVFGRALGSGRSWRRVLSGRAEYRAAFGQLKGYARSLVHRRERRTEEEKTIQRLAAMAGRRQPLLFVYSNGDPAHLYLKSLLAAPSAGRLGEKLDVRVLEDETHTFVTLGAQQAVFRTIEDWLELAYLGL